MQANITEQLLAREAASLEETKRFNAEREIAKALAPQKWTELKCALQNQCEMLSRTASRHSFECEEPDEFRFFLNRIVRKVALRAVEFRFEPALPGILSQSEHAGSGAITFLVSDDTLFYKIGNRGLILGDFIMDLLLKLTR